MDIIVLFFVFIYGAIVCGSVEYQEESYAPSKVPTKPNPVLDKSLEELITADLSVEPPAQNEYGKENILEPPNVPLMLDPISKDYFEESKSKQEKSAELTPKGHVLFFHSMGTLSQIIAMSALAEGLLEHGHKVTTVFFARSNIVHENYTEILIQDKFADFYKKWSQKLVEYGGNTFDPRLWFEFTNKDWLKANLSNVCTGAITDSPVLLKMIQEKIKVDAVILYLAAFLPTCGIVLPHLFDSPLILFSTTGPISLQLAPGLGNPINPLAQPYNVAPFIEPMTFLQRIANVLLEGAAYGFRSREEPLSLELIRDHFGKSTPDYRTIMKDRSAFAIVNSHFVTHGSWPLYKNVAEVGGIHCKAGKELPTDLREYLDAHPEGVVYVSFGSFLSPSTMTDEQKNVFFEAFRELENVAIIWKWNEDELSGIPKNVLVRKWLPQNDLLAHKNLKVFVTHGGLLSIQEALYHSVPLVGVPFGFDQKPNLLRAQQHGYAIILTLQTMTKEDLKSSIQKAMTDKAMHKAMGKMHDLFTEEYNGSPMERGVRAVEYVIKHKNLDFLKPTETMFVPFYQWYGFDIFVFILGILLFSTWMALTIGCYCLRRCCYKKTKQD